MVKLAISQIAWDLKNDDEILPFLETNNYQGIELIPTKIQLENPYDHVEQFKKYFEKLSKYHLVVPSMQSLIYGRTENIFDPKDGPILVNYLKKAISFAGQLGIKNLVFGSPKNRLLPDNYSEDKIINIFKELGDYALENQTIFAVEANPSIYGGNFILTTKEAIDLIKKVNSQGLKLNLDLGTVIENNEDLSDILSNDLNLINHIHLSEPSLKKVLIHENLYSVLSQHLKDYSGFLSIEMKNLNDLNATKEIILEIKEYFSNVID
ncbi:sugar phosphate isomerase/epimerase family protein [Xylocopilactobacillus apis]|uniref:Xylose isomerase-like TIM barrel domain-containing protein n=1 Tax=Xylocopilactobacillus apis TaxID=2932183 RepID=A0AAU9CRD4_9LACO|nr:TIM barrel protein [Xylocopilactobacillus apis]BDR56489.1 hypothetical protein KIMC2_10510 [Xylocopilactobacillus apis]